ncbi:MAG: DUF1540 domain-containing protein [bacterium]|nr:DUF1540 domain-containing protein [bacterium]
MKKDKHQTIKCDVTDCKYCNCDESLCTLDKIKVCCENCDCALEKSGTICDSFKKK